MTSNLISEVVCVEVMIVTVEPEIVMAEAEIVMVEPSSSVPAGHCPLNDDEESAMKIDYVAPISHHVVN
jgi:hypothetical protein